MSDETLASPSDTDFTSAILLAWQGKIDLVGLFEVANKLSEKGLNPLAAVLYRTWLNRNNTAHNHLVYFNLGVVLSNEKALVDAKEAYIHAIQLAPTFSLARFNLGLVYERLGQTDSSIAEWLWIESHTSPDDPEQRHILLLALNNLGRHYENNRQYAEAQSCLTKSLRIEPNQPDVIHHWVFLRERQCLWPIYESVAGLNETFMNAA